MVRVQLLLSNFLEYYSAAQLMQLIFKKVKVQRNFHNQIFFER